MTTWRNTVIDDAVAVELFQQELTVTVETAVCWSINRLPHESRRDSAGRHLAVFAGISFDPYEIDVLDISKG